MKMNVTFNYELLCKKVLRERLDTLGFPYQLTQRGEITFTKTLSPEQQDSVKQVLAPYGIEILLNQQAILVQQIKDTITEMVRHPEKTRKYNVSSYLSSRLHYSYSHLSTVFSEETHSSIEQFIILKKIDAAKTLIMEKRFTLTEIAHRLDYSSVAHLSAQFKKTTGLTPSAFERIITKRTQV
ncbi:helix-turn-helix domain-containing protein [Maribacter sp. 2307ULW6-5]|uniref:helix-turn-helix domain-containing protein n=1 Tax=Maribacter sp. 2307ULW6-5 TaxID=3386275 RepID=UPI0039BC2F98